MRRALVWMLRLLALLALVATAFVELDLLFSDLGPGETSADRHRVLVLVLVLGVGIALLLWLLGRRLRRGA